MPERGGVVVRDGPTPRASGRRAWSVCVSKAPPLPHPPTFPLWENMMCTARSRSRTVRRTGLALVAAASTSNRIVQAGAQRTSSVTCAKAKELYDSGAIGKLSLVEATLGRNDPTGAWEYPPPPDLSPANLGWDTWLGSAPK